MREWILTHEPELRFGSFLAVFALMALWETLGSRRELQFRRRRRWLANLGLAVLDSLLVRLFFPAAAVGVALMVERLGWGFLNQFELPAGVLVPLSVVALDLAIYLQHVMFHAVPILWRFHQVHHADQDFDLTTGIRFHPVEILLSVVIKFGVIAALGPAPVGVLLFAVLLNATAMFNHGNVKIRRGFDRLLRWLIVTPDMHRVHHSVKVSESNSNFGFNLPWWDRLFGTYRAQPEAGHRGMTVGVEHLQLAEPGGVVSLLSLPFVAATGRYPLASRFPEHSGPADLDRAD
jgi:sterol desaturase/sphingolipid hydroxylase (fatty acid hydroxylase superfamily)